MVNQFGLDASYFENRLNRVLTDIAHFTPAELARELARMSKVADPSILQEPEFADKAESTSTIDLDQIAMTRIRAAVGESNWIPPEYISNDWMSDICEFLRNRCGADEQRDDFGLPIAQEPKYTVNSDGRLINRATRIAIPDDEPVFIFRACDTQANVGLRAYLNVLCNKFHLKAVAQRIKDFDLFKTNHPARMKVSDTAG